MDYLYVYMFVYNMSLFIIFMCLFQIFSLSMRTTHSFNTLGYNNPITKFIIIALFSMAGVPPFFGFFTKVFLFQLLCMTNFSLFYPFFFTILFLGLYFYIQNIRFLNASNASNFTPLYEQNMRNVPVFYYLMFTLSLFLIFGFGIIDDVLIIISWILA